MNYVNGNFINEQDITNETTYLYRAVASANIDEVKRLLNIQYEIHPTTHEMASIVNPNIPNKEGYAPIDEAIRQGNIEIVKILLDFKEIFIHRNDNTHTVLGIAVSSNTDNTEEIVKLILQNTQLRINAREKKMGNTALHNTVGAVKKDVIQLLLAHPGIRVNVQNKAGNTPLLEAAIQNDVAIFQALLKDQRIDTTIANNNGKTLDMLLTTNGVSEEIKNAHASILAEKSTSNVAAVSNVNPPQNQ
jgi:ankyrin repeat protein